MSRKEIGMHQVGVLTSAQAAGRAMAPICQGYLALQSIPGQRQMAGMAGAIERASGRPISGR
ncbi:Mycobacterium numidiamassiliense ORFan [Mycobacterium numidiamassiliense]|uniref:Mycobacterium numidiamassiliense ORFan n=1 Tax=Mycobacterium numidiamassiliense TaxID=1841861 RepID=A0A2U3P533_9MYCO|nr:Mycobacterium numidiamassiliense ORFan [Mycobacterium numidiamassiliense]